MNLLERSEGKYTLTSQRQEYLRIKSDRLNITLHQLEVLVLFSQGKSLNDVAQETKASYTTLDRHVDNACEQNGISGTARKTKLALLLRGEELLNELALIGLRAILKEMWEERSANERA